MRYLCIALCRRVNGSLKLNKLHRPKNRKGNESSVVGSGWAASNSNVTLDVWLRAVRGVLPHVTFGVS